MTQLMPDSKHSVPRRKRSAGAAGEEIRRLREASGFTRGELAEQLGYSVKQIARWETGACIPKPPVIRVVREVTKHYVPPAERPSRPDPGFRFVDLFAGIGGLRRGFEPYGRCVFTSEWDKYAQRTYRANYVTDHEIAGDITKVRADEIPEHDLLLAGFPCQPFSLAGVSKKNSLGRPHGFECNTQGTLFFDVERIIAHHRPKAFLLENVKHLLRHDAGQTWATIRYVLETRLGYKVHPLIVDARRVLPQHRERIYIVGFRHETSFDADALDLGPIENGPTLKGVLHPEDGSEYDADASRFIDDLGQVQSRYALSDHLWAYLQAYAKKHRERGNGFGFGLVNRDSVARTLSARYHKDGSEILVDRGRGRNPRRLTPRECARLMGFDPLLGACADAQARFTIPHDVSDTQLYRQFGNSVAVPVVSALARLMVPHLIGTAGPPDQIALPLSAPHR